MTTDLPGVELTPAQQRTFNQIMQDPHTGNRVYGRFNTTTLKALESKGLIKVHKFGGLGLDDIEILD